MLKKKQIILCFFYFSLIFICFPFATISIRCLKMTDQKNLPLPTTIMYYLWTNSWFFISRNMSLLLHCAKVQIRMDCSLAAVVCDCKFCSPILSIENRWLSVISDFVFYVCCADCQTHIYVIVKYIYFFNKRTALNTKVKIKITLYFMLIFRRRKNAENFEFK